MHPHHWVRSPGSFLLNDSGMVAGDGIEPPSPAYETGLEPLQLSRKKFVRIFGCQTSLLLWHRVKDSNPHRPGWSRSCCQLHQPCASNLRTANWTRAEVSNLEPPDSESGVLPIPPARVCPAAGDSTPSRRSGPGVVPDRPTQEPPLIARPTYGALFLLKAKYFLPWPFVKSNRNDPSVVRVQPERIRRRRTGYDRRSTLELHSPHGICGGTCTRTDGSREPSFIDPLGSIANC